MAPPPQLTPVTADLDEATEWFEALPAVMGVEGLVVKGEATRYTPGRRDAWVEVNSVGVKGALVVDRSTICRDQAPTRGVVAVSDTCRARAGIVWIGGP